MSEQKIEEIQNVLANVNINKFMIQCLFVLNRDLIWNGGVENPHKAQDNFISAMNILKKFVNTNFDSDDVDRCLQKNIKYILEQTEVVKG